MRLSAIRERVAADTVRLAPKTLFSEAVGWGARVTVPRPLRARAYTAFARVVGASLDEVELPLSEYRSLGSFFARRLRPGARDVANDPGIGVSPCDGRVASAGEAEGGRMIQAKGHDYGLADLLVDPELSAALDGGAYVTIYLAPRDYHRVHSPCDGELYGYDYVPGTLFPVSPRWAARVPNLFARNERVVMHMRGELGRFALVMVGAAGVGNMALAHDRVSTRSWRGAGRDPIRVRYDEPIPVARGDELGCFQLGSTVVLVFEPKRVRIRARDGDVVRFGQPLAAPRRASREGAAA